MKKASSCLADPYLEMLIRRLLLYEPERIILFGSRARGAADEQSDYDIILIKRTALPFLVLERLWEVVPFLARFERAVEVLVYTPEEFEQMRETGIGWVAHREGVVLYERSSD